MTSLAIEAPAPLLDTLDLYRRAELAIPLLRKTAILQWFKSDTFGFRDGADLVAVFGLCPVPGDELGETVLELWFACSPAIVPHLLAIAHIARLTLRRATETSGLRIVATVRLGHRPGQRLAALAGLQRAGELGDCEFWEWRSAQ